MNRSVFVGLAASLAIVGQSTLAYGAAVPVSSFSGGTYVQNFDTLNSGTSASANAQNGWQGTYAWNDGTTLTGWHAWVTNPTGGSLTPDVPTYYFNSNGTNPLTGRLLNLGTNNNTDRALGLSSPNNSNQYIGVRLANDTGSALTSFTVTYDAEQWRLIGGNHPADQLLVQYRLFDAGQGSVNAAAFADWTTIPSLSYTSATTADATTALDGNLAANRVADITATVDVDWQDGQELWVRWVDFAHANGPSSHQIGIDNVRISAVPEPASVGLILGAIGLNLLRGRKR